MTEPVTLTRLTLKKDDPYYELIMKGYNRAELKNHYLREALIYISLINERLPTLKLFLDKQVGLNKPESLDEEKLYQWLSVMREADGIMNGLGTSSHAAPSHAAPSHTAPGHTAPGHTAPGHAAPGHAEQITKDIPKEDKISKTNIKASFSNLVKNANQN